MRLGRRRRLPGEVADHERRAGALVDAVEAEYRRRARDRALPVLPGVVEAIAVDEVRELESGRALLTRPREELVSVAIVSAARIVSEPAFIWAPPYRILTALARKRLPYVTEDARLLLVIASRALSGWAHVELLKPALAAAEAAGPAGLETELRTALARIEQADGADAAKLRGRLLALLGDDAVGYEIVGEDAWAERVRPLVAEGPPAGRLLVHLSQATSSAPTQAWRKAAWPLAEGREDLLRILLEAAAETKPTVAREYEWEGQTYREWHYLARPNETLVKGTAWAAGVVDAGWAAPLLGRIVETARDHAEALSNACLNVLGELSDERALHELVRLQARVKHRGFQKRIGKALEQAAARAGVTRTQLLERQVPVVGLDASGRKEVAVGGFTAVVQVDDRHARLAWRTPAGGEQRSVPEHVRDEHADELKALKAEVAEIRRALSTERGRFEGLLAEESRWPFGEWRRRYLEHPLVSRFARGLIWSFDGESALGADAPEDAGEVELWHPIRASEDEVAAWRSRLLEHELRQPLKQAFREVYLLAPAERETRLYSNRFAAHVLDYPRAYALFKERGWTGNALGPWDEGYEAEVSREFPAQGMRAAWYLQYVEDDGTGPIAALATTDQVRFHPSGRRDPEPLPLEEVPALVFSEAMRDVDLFVGVASIAADPAWIDRGLDRFHPYWYEASFGELAESAAVRRGVLRELLPRLAIADRLELEDRFLVVRGDLRTYRIHLGSANVLMEPNDRYLCIVPAPGAERRKGTLFLPFEDDARLNVILSKAVLLANDVKIADPSIRAQIEGG